jgi:hypothetical protein
LLTATALLAALATLSALTGLRGLLTGLLLSAALSALAALLAALVRLSHGESPRLISLARGNAPAGLAFLYVCADLRCAARDGHVK